MAIKQRLLGLLTAVDNILNQTGEADKPETRKVLLQRLAVAREMCRKGLPENRYSAYGEICDWMVATAGLLMKNSVADKQGELISLLFGILRKFTAQLEKDPHFKKELVFLPYKVSM